MTRYMYSTTAVDTISALCPRRKIRLLLGISSDLPVRTLSRERVTIITIPTFCIASRSGLTSLACLPFITACVSHFAASALRAYPTGSRLLLVGQSVHAVVNSLARWVLADGPGQARERDDE
jgi:hypothetical protein